MSYRFLSLITLALAGLSLAASHAAAADLDPGYAQIPQLQEEKVEFGSGWYIRGDLGATNIPKVSASTPLVGYAPGIVFSPNKSFGYTASLGAGYSFNRWFRADAIFDFHQPVESMYDGANFACQNGYGLTPSVTNADGSTTAAVAYNTFGTCTGHYKASLKSYDALVNGYVDLGNWRGVTPYLGAGVGLSFGHYQTAATYTQADASSYNISITNPVSSATYHIFEDRSASGQYYNLAFALMAGLTYDLTDHAKLDVGYRYLHLGSILGSSLSMQEVRAGLRYMIDN